MKRLLMIHILCSYCEDAMLIVCCGNLVMLKGDAIRDLLVIVLFRGLSLPWQRHL